ncbi:MAG: DNA-processing protein DprA [Pseudomonadota bacterium]|nr:DNA-processing protein DprA [Pseudomonadota bacterium]
MNLSDQERLAWHRLAQSENVGPITFERLLQRFGSASQALAGVPELSRRGGLRRPLKLYEEARAVRDFERSEKLGSRYIASCEQDYPDLLRQSPAPPPLICVKGRVELLTKPCIAIVGARNASAAGLRFARMVALALGEAGLVIVSGLARGIDTAAHQASIGQGTVAVVAGGIDHFYPPENVKLQEAIADQGVVMSEMPPGTVPKAESFPRRNRIIAGLAQGTVIVEAAMRSGSLITARFANESGREVFAVPGSPLDPRCEGTNGLIKDGAHLLQRASDVLDVCQFSAPQNLRQFEEAEIVPASETTEPVRQRILGLLSHTPVSLDDVAREAEAQSWEVQAVVIELELAGQLLRQPGGKVVLA